MAEGSSEADEYGVLLYYKYAHVPDLDSLFNFYDSNCNSLSLLGRVRLASHGVNVTVGGKLSSLEEHIAAMKSNSLFEGTDFKLASCKKPTNDTVAEECGFTSLSIRIVKELVTFSSHPLLKSPEISNAGKHLSAVAFHSVIQNPGQLLEEDSSTKLVLLDARNLYETRIGKFDPPNVETLDPEIRQYSDLSAWIDKNSDQLRGKCILMYCTGGIRCEMASAYIRSKGSGFESVYQLYGGIQRYLEQYPNGGFFKGKNFVFDHRVSVSSSDENVMGTCLLCSSSFDDYSSRNRCSYCRMLVLVCSDCQERSSPYICELCQKYGEDDSFSVAGDGKLQERAPSIDHDTVSSSFSTTYTRLQRNGIRSCRKLRILCLHGFRQNASSFKGRTASLSKKLKCVAELVFVNAPHELQFFYRPTIPSNQNPIISSPPPRSCNKKFAWFVSPDYTLENSDADWIVASSSFDPLQYQQQNEGFDASLSYLKWVFSEHGPFDGILGFSQGAAMAASIAALKGKLKGEVDFRFVILCSGFASKLVKRERELIYCPSLHIFGNDLGKDRQIANAASRELCSLFDKSCSTVVEHECGHIIPTRSPYINEIKDFLLEFL